MQLPIPIWASIAGGVCALGGAIIGAFINPFITSRFNERTRRLDLYKLAYPQKLEAAKLIMQHASLLMEKYEILKGTIYEKSTDGEKVRQQKSIFSIFDTITKEAEELRKISNKNFWLMHKRVNDITYYFLFSCLEQENIVKKILVANPTDHSAYANMLRDKIETLMTQVEGSKRIIEAHSMNKGEDVAPSNGTEFTVEDKQIVEIEVEKSHLLLDEITSLRKQVAQHLDEEINANSRINTAIREQTNLSEIKIAYNELCEAVRDETHIVEFDRLFPVAESRKQWSKRSKHHLARIEARQAETQETSHSGEAKTQ